MNIFFSFILSFLFYFFIFFLFALNFGMKVPEIGYGRMLIRVGGLSLILYGFLFIFGADSWVDFLLGSVTQFFIVLILFSFGGEGTFLWIAGGSERTREKSE